MNNKKIKIPEEILKFIHSGNVYSKLESIGDKYGLNLDKLGDLNVITEKAMIGEIKSSDFIGIVSKNLEVSEEVAENIANDISNDIMLPIRSSLQKIQEGSEFDYDNVEPQTTQNQSQTIPKPTFTPTPPTPITPTLSSIPTTPPLTPPTPPPTPTTPPVFVAKTIAIPKPEPMPQPTIMPKTVEEAGRFTIERPPVGMPQYKETEIKKDVILGMIEDKEEIKTPTPITISTPSYIPEKPVINLQQPKPIQNTVVENKTINPEPPKQDLPKTPVVERKPYTVDPYREQI